MINFQLRSYISALEDLDLAKTRAMSGPADDRIPDDERERIAERIRPIARDAATLWMETALARLSRLEIMLANRTPTYGLVLREIEELWNALDHDSYKQFFYHYPADAAALVQNAPLQWEAAFAAFASIKGDVLAGIDCYAFGDDSGCIFHMCRAAEAGLRAVARERGIKRVRARGQPIPLDWGTWGVILGALDKKVEEVRKRPNGPQRDAALAFYNGVLSDVRHIQDYRDNTMHLRSIDYKSGQSNDAMYRVHALMTRLASKLDENSTSAIPWKAWK